MDKSDIAWAVILGAGLAYEVRALLTTRAGDTLSEKTRAVFSVRSSRAGRITFLVAWTGFSGWFLGHILDWWA